MTPETTTRDYQYLCATLLKNKPEVAYNKQTWQP